MGFNHIGGKSGDNAGHLNDQIEETRISLYETDKWVLALEEVIEQLRAELYAAVAEPVEMPAPVDVSQIYIALADQKTALMDCKRALADMPIADTTAIIERVEHLLNRVKFLENNRLGIAETEKLLQLAEARIRTNHEGVISGVYASVNGRMQVQLNMINALEKRAEQLQKRFWLSVVVGVVINAVWYYTVS